MRVLYYQTLQPRWGVSVRVVVLLTVIELVCFGVVTPASCQDSLSSDQVSAFARLALDGIGKEFPNKPSNVMDSADDVQSPREMHPVFYGSFDWHSSVHGHWMLAKLLRDYPGHAIAGEIRQTLHQQFTAPQLKAEAEYFAADYNESFERMYGWAWLMQLVAELDSWQDSDANRWRENLRPLEDQILVLMNDYLPKLSFPIRTGVHQDTGFALAMLLDYARVTKRPELEALLVKKAREFYSKDVDYPAHYEPSGHDFFSPGFNEADLMRRVLSAQEFASWFNNFLPQMKTNEMGPMMIPVEVPDVTDGHLVHLAGLNLSRAWTMQGIASVLAQNDPRKQILLASAERHAAAGLKYVTSGHYEGEHWLASFAVYMLSSAAGTITTPGDAPPTK